MQAFSHQLFTRFSQRGASQKEKATAANSSREWWIDSKEYDPLYPQAPFYTPTLPLDPPFV
jgi:hypothetical protein